MIGIISSSFAMNCICLYFLKLVLKLVFGSGVFFDGVTISDVHISTKTFLAEKQKVISGFRFYLKKFKMLMTFNGFHNRLVFKRCFSFCMKVNFSVSTNTILLSIFSTIPLL